MSKKYQQLTPDEVDHFLEHGFVVVKAAFSQKKADEWTKTMWVRMGLDPNDKTTWDRERIHMPSHQREQVANFAPKAWKAICDLLGGEDRIDKQSSSWGDSFIVNLGTDELEGEGKSIHPRDLGNWHVDGDFFVHYLDSPEQALLVIPIFSKIEPRGGGTMISPDGLRMVAQYLAAHPEGVQPAGFFFPANSTYSNPRRDPGYWSPLDAAKKCNQFIEMTGDVGDVVLLHPFMLHSASKNHLRIPRIITNPPVLLKQPFNFSRENPDDFSLVERKTLRELGVAKLDYKITTQRRRIVPQRLVAQNKMKEDEKSRLISINTSG